MNGEIELFYTIPGIANWRRGQQGSTGDRLENTIILQH